MKIKSLLDTLSEVAIENDLGTPYIVGGIPRDVLLKTETVFHDIDITTGRDDIDKLAEAFAQKTNGSGRGLSDHKQVIIDGLKFDFSSNFKYKNIKDLIKAKEYTVSDELAEETFSRDFTVNALLLSLDFKQIVDVTGKGIEHLENGILACPLDCTLSFKESPNRILRAFYYKAKFGFKFDDSVSKAIKDNLDLLKTINARYASEMINSIVRADPSILEELIEIGALQKIPLTKYLTKVLLKNRRILDVI